MTTIWSTNTFIIALILIIFHSSAKVDAYVEALAANIDTGLTHFQPMVAILCGHGKYHNQYLDENKRWITDPDPKAVCTKDKLEILEYCRKVYPKKDVRNIVESSKYYKISSWCKVGQKKCRAKHWIKPFRCLEGPFQSDALLVPEHCLFDHIHNQSVCQSSEYWNQTATTSCDKRSMKLQSFAMLLPCGVGIFSGVEFVCCPNPHTNVEQTTTRQLHTKTGTKTDVSDNIIDDSKQHKVTENIDSEDDDNSDEEDDDDYYDDDYDDDDNDVKSSSTTTTTTTTTTTSTTTTTERPVDYYLSHFDSQREHDSFKSAQKSLEDNHRQKVTKVMKEWSELEEHYQEMRIKDPKGAEDFKKKMTGRFQKTVEALEEEGSAEKRQLISMHQQRVMTIINLRKKSAMDCFTQSLDQSPPKTKRIEKCLEKLLRALEKDRTHTLHHFRHLLNSYTKQALKDKEAMLDHLDDLIRMANQSIQMLDRVPNIADKIRRRMIAFWHNLRGIPIDEKISKETELAIMDRYEEEVAQKQQEKERQKMIEEQRKQELKELQDEKKRVEANQKSGKLEQEFDPESMEDERTGTSDDENSDQSRSASAGIVAPTPTTVSSTPMRSNVLIPHEDEETNEVHDMVPTPKQAYQQSQAFHHNEASYSIRREPYHQRLRWNGSVYITLAFAGIALLTATIVGIVLLRKHTQRSPHSQGFVEVDQAVSPEERHVANMQINGYENPTYKYFEATQTQA